MNTNVTVIGGAGFIGSHLVESLIDLGFNVTVIDNLSTGSLSNIDGLPVRLRIFDITGDVNELADLLVESDCVFHLAALTSVQESLENPSIYTKVNVSGTANVLEACRIAKVNRLVFSSTSAVYGNTNHFPTPETAELSPISQYALSKQLGELYCKLYSDLYGIHTTCLRYFNVYGNRTNPKSSYKSVIPVFLEKFKKGEPLPITNDGKQCRDFVHVKDVAAANITAMSQRGLHKIVNIGSGTTISVNEIADIIGGVKIDGGPRLEPKISLADITKATNLFDWKPSVNLVKWIKGQTL